MEALWTPSEDFKSSTLMTKFMNDFASHMGVDLKDYQELHKLSVTEPDEFWSFFIDWTGIQYRGSKFPVNGDYNFKEYSWFPKIELNFAQNLLNEKYQNETAITFLHESGLRKDYSYSSLRLEVGAFQSTLKEYIGRGDVLACYMPNIPETAIAMLATSALGGVFTSTSSDFGIEGVVDRFGQSKPKVLVAASNYQYNGKTFDQLEKLKEIEKQLPFIEKIILVDFTGESSKEHGLGKGIWWDEFTGEQCQPEYSDIPFDSPLYIMYSSGTTGKPKCIVHSVGGTLIQHHKEHKLHTNVKEGTKLFYFTTCGWMMWNWLISGLACGAEVILYEGSPGYPSLAGFVEKLDSEGVEILGTSPKFLKALEDNEYDKNFEFKNLKSLLSTGAPLLPEQYDWIYKKFHSNICVSSISGGTDIIGCFMLGNPNVPVYRGEIQCLGLGMDVACFDDDGKALDNKEGELVCRQSFPSRPLYFLNDKNNERINDAYFNRFENTWHHGDFIKITEYGGVVVYGRSDATLNPGGVRIGTAEVYRQTESLNWMSDSLCVGRQVDGDVEIVLFVKLNEGEELTEERVVEVKKLIKAKTTPRHVPRYVWAINDIPYTRSGKKMELAINRIINGRELKNIEAVANPECLAEYESYRVN
ncbi:MAG: acetoacetate--CoA ligase [Oligoflexia bacterium]|nr:acetoacetate--CoA ligase [Oligoflexia bacterium]